MPSFDFSSFAAVLLDLDGTIYHEEHLLPGARELVRRLQEEGRPYACLTNSTSSEHRISARLGRLGIPTPPTNIYSAGCAAADYVLERFGPQPRVFNLATEGVHELLNGKVTWVTTEHEPCDAIIIGAPINVYATPDRQRIALHLAKRGALLVGICADRVFPSPRGLELGCGALTVSLAYGASVTPVYTGKPDPIFFNELCHSIHVDPARCVLIGDNVESDIAGAKTVGMKTILVLTGVTSREDVARIPPELRPDWVASDLRDLV